MVQLPIFQNVSREEVAAPSHSLDISDAQVEVPSQKAIIEDVEVPSNIASIAQHMTSSLKKYASDADSASDDDTPVNLYAVVDWELLPTGLGSINAFYRLDNSRKYFTSLREILHLGDLKVLMDSPEVNDVRGLVLHMVMDKKLSSLCQPYRKEKADHQLEICRGTVDKKGDDYHEVRLSGVISKSVDGCQLASPRVNGYLVKASSNPLLFFDSPLPGVNTPWDVMRISASIVFVFLLLLDVALAAAHSPVSILKLTSEDLSRNLKLTVSNSSLGEDC
ncbi:hypothetical protein Tco_0780304 [Tanacetum coccineum]